MRSILIVKFVPWFLPGQSFFPQFPIKTYFCSVQCFESWVNMPSGRKQAVSGNIFSCPDRQCGQGTMSMYKKLRYCYTPYRAQDSSISHTFTSPTIRQRTTPPKVDSSKETPSTEILSGGSTAPLWELWKFLGCFRVTVVITMSSNLQKTTD